MCNILGNGFTDVFEFFEVDFAVHLSQSEATSEMIHV